MPYWMSIEVFDGRFAASSWVESYGDSLVGAAISTGAADWSWQRTSWGVVFEVAFADQDDWERFRQLLVVQIALDAVPDPVGGLLIYRGRGGSSGTTRPRKPRPIAGAGAAALPIPIIDEEWLNLSGEVERRTLLPVPAGV
jgi:hypothetical protein